VKKKSRVRLTWHDIDIAGAKFIEGMTLKEIGQNQFDKPVSRQRVHQVINKVKRFFASA
jgi:ABC-type transporter MlaC component